MVFTTVFDALKTLLDAGTYAGLTFTTKVKSSINPQNEPAILEPILYKDGASPILASAKCVGILENDMVDRTLPNWQGADQKRYDGTISLYAVSWNNLADLIEDILKVGTDLKSSLLRFSEPSINQDREDALFSAEMRYGWEKIVAHG